MALQTLTLKNGDKVKVNDHVYCSPNWAIRDGTPYSVARIMEFLPPEEISKEKVGLSLIKGKGKENPARVRLAWYYRPSDVSDRPVADWRLLLAAIYSEICEVTQLRAKCHVIHRDKISDLAGWKKRPDRFYFTRLFDPYIKKEFEVIQATDVRNIPEHVRTVLVSRYEYVVAEKEVVPDLTDNLRLCETCTDWCSTPETVQCDRCKKYFHMRCVQPPLSAKPSRGYGWTCAPCSRQHEEEVDSHHIRHVTPVASKPKSNAPAPRGRGRPRKDRTLAEKEENMEIKHFKMWPFRYFGQYTVAEDTLDPDDLIFPRTATRVGPKFQANIPPLSGVSDPSTSEAEDRGGDSTIEILGVVNKMADSEVAGFEGCIMDIISKTSPLLPPEIASSVDFLTEVIHRLSQAYLEGRPLHSVSMNNPFRLEKWKKSQTRYIDKPWETQERAAFEDAILYHGAELRLVRDEIGTRSVPEVVRFYGRWKNNRLREENSRIRAVRESRQPSPSSMRTLFPPTSEDESSVVEEPIRGNAGCAACRTRESKVWWKAPKGLQTEIMCDNCGPNWRKYADLNIRPTREEPPQVNKAKLPEKREGSPLNGSSSKRIKTSAPASVQSTPPPAQSAVPHLRCLACQKNGPIGKVLRCQQCQLRVHAGACGASPDPASVESWICDLCQNEKTLEASLNSDCVLCPRRTDSKGRAGVLGPASYLRACKPTEGQGWVHILCSAFIPEITFTDSARFRLVEGISTIPRQRWQTLCMLCGEEGGAVIRCSDCTKEFHCSCAWRCGYKFGFEIQPVKSSRRDMTTVTTFNGEVGLMNPVVCCKEHDISRRDIYDICQTNEGGETALQIYVRLYKQAQVSQSHGLLRKARRLDQILDARSEGSVTSEGSQALEPECYKCHTTFSPCFYRLPPSIGSFMAQDVPDAWLCHKCHYATQDTVKSDIIANMVS